MKKLSQKLPFLLLLLLFACSGPQDPEFQTMENVRITKLNMTKVEITGDAVLNNPNPVGCNLKSMAVDVKVNGVDAGTVEQTLNASVPANADFRVPIKVNIPPTKIYKDWASLAIGILTGVSKKEIEVKYSGKIVLDFSGVLIEVPIEETESIPLKKG